MAPNLAETAPELTEEHPSHGIAPDDCPARLDVGFSVLGDGEKAAAAWMDKPARSENRWQSQGN
ncbi:hypothetical protein ACFV5J_10365 [Streptomyces zaomyceticus]|uniref:hypothetical protein n=1 Tax=Streptomyces zaomyceticus TaxID=68286 RepID=UPI0036620856